MSDPARRASLTSTLPPSELEPVDLLVELVGLFAWLDRSDGTSNPE